MAGNAGFVALLGDLEQHHVVIAIQAHFVHQLHMAGLFALEPEAVARAAEIDRPAQFRRLGQGLAVHPGKHQHVARAALLRNHRHQALRVPFHFIEPVHIDQIRTGMPRSAMRCLAWPTVYSP
ncbi:hypothetical protein D3C78_1296710 [compost metagenome]